MCVCGEGRGTGGVLEVCLGREEGGEEGVEDCFGGREGGGQANVPIATHREVPGRWTQSKGAGALQGPKPRMSPDAARGL